MKKILYNNELNSSIVCDGLTHAGWSIAITLVCHVSMSSIFEYVILLSHQYIM